MVDGNKSSILLFAGGRRPMGKKKGKIHLNFVNMQCDSHYIMFE